MVLSIALGIVLAVGIIYGIFVLYGMYWGHKMEKEEEKRLSRNAEMEELKEKGKLRDAKPEKRFSERLREKDLEMEMKSKKDSGDSVVKGYIIGFCVFCGIAIIIVVTVLISKL